MRTNRIINHGKRLIRKPSTIIVKREVDKVYTQKDCERIAAGYSGIFFDTSKNILGAKYKFRCKNNHIFESDPKDIKERKYFCTNCYEIGKSGENITDAILISALSTIFGKSVGNLYISNDISIYTIDSILCVLEGINYRNSAKNKDVSTILTKYSKYRKITVSKKTILNDLVNDIVIQLDNKKNNKLDFIEHYNSILLKNLGVFDIRYYVLVFMKKVLYSQATKIEKNRFMSILPEYKIGWNIRKESSFKNKYDVVNGISCINIPTNLEKKDVIKYIIDTMRLFFPTLNTIIGDDIDKFIKVSDDHINSL